MTDLERVIEQELAGAERPSVTSSFQAECVVLVHALRQVVPNIPVLFLETFHHFPETLAYRDRIVEAWALNLVVLRADSPAVGLWRSSTTDCCARHKVGPLFSALEQHDRWFTGLRREQSKSRATLEVTESFALPSGQSIRKVSPLALWTTADVWSYAKRHGIPLLPLYEQGYTSIGCEPCTTRPLDPADPRSGRWGGHKLECGIHVGASRPGC